MPKASVGVLGTGWVATARHIPSYRRHPDAEVVAVYDRNPERGRQTAEALGIPRAVSSEQEFFQLDLDIVSVCTPPWTHAALACAALESGKHVFTEKPMAMNAAEAAAMVDAARSSGRLLCVSHNFLFSRAVQKADRLLGDNGEVSYVFGVQLSSLARRLPSWYTELPAGLLLDESPHMLYTLQHFLGPLQLDGVRATMNPASGLPATAEIRVRGISGIGQVTMLFETPVSEWHVGVVGRRRAIDLDLFRDIVVSVTSDAAHKPIDILRTSSRVVGGHALGFATSGARYVSKRLFWGHDVIIGRFIDATLGRGPVPVSDDESVGIVRLTDAILAELYQSTPG